MGTFASGMSYKCLRFSAVNRSHYHSAGDCGQSLSRPLLLDTSHDESTASEALPSHVPVKLAYIWTGVVCVSR